MTEPTATIVVPAEQRLADALAAYDAVQRSYNELLAKFRAQTSELTAVKVERDTQARYAAELRKGLEFYKPGPFWDTVLKDTKADEDQGKHAEWVLRLTNPDAT